MTAADGPGGGKRLRRKAKTEGAGGQQGSTGLGPSKEVVGSETRARGGKNRLRRVAGGVSYGGNPHDVSALGPHRVLTSSKTRSRRGTHAARSNWERRCC